MAQRRGPDGTCRVAVTGVWHGESWANVFWCNLIGGITATQANLDQWTSSFGEDYALEFAPLLPSTCSVTAASSTLFQPGETALHSVHPMSHAGTNAGVEVENNASCKVISWRSNVYWRGGKPRTYIPGLFTAETDDSKTLNPATVGGVQNVANQFHTAVNSIVAGTITTTQHGFVSFMSGGVDRNPSVFFAISGATVHARIGTQRGRLGPWQN